MVVNRGTLRVEAELNTLIGGALDAQTRTLVEAWVVGWEQVSAEWDAALTDLAMAGQDGRITRTMVVRSQRAQAALEATATTLGQLAEQAGFTIAQDLQALIDHASRAEHDMIASQLTGVRRADLRASLVRADPGQIRAMVQRATERITSLTRPLGVEATTAVRRELLRGIAVGTNPRQAARRMVRGVEDKFLGGLNRALVISRTELLDATRAAQQATDAANADVLAGWVWLAHLDPATCRSCVAQHGNLHPIDQPGPLDHQQGRCTRVPKTKSWEELGFTGIEDPPDSTPDAVAWFNNLTEDQQRAMLTDRGFDAWQRGQYPMESWSSRRTVDGWRDSWGASRPPQPLPTPERQWRRGDWMVQSEILSRYDGPTHWDDEFLENYISDGYRNIREYLMYDGPAPQVGSPAWSFHTRQEAEVRGMDELFRNHGVDTTEDLVLFRGEKTIPSYDPGQMYQVGEFAVQPTYTSTSVDEGLAKSFAGREGWNIEVQVPAGSRVLPGQDEEGELILPRNSRFRVVSKNTENRIIRLILEGQTP